MHVSREVYCNLKQLDICYATPTHRGTTGGQCRLRTPEPIPSIVTTTRNSVVKQTGVDNANLITLTFTESRNGSTTTKPTNKWNLLTLVNVAKLNVHYINVRSVKNKAISVSDLVISRDIDILALTETWVAWQRHRRSRDKYISSMWIRLHSVSRPHGIRGGGVAVLYKSGLAVKPIPMRDNYSNFEHSDYYVTIRAVTFRLCVVYHPPPSKRNGFSNTVFFDQWSAFLDDIMLDTHDIIITGDLNFHLDIPTQLDVKRFSESLCDRGMKQLVNEATHSKGHILDVVIVRDNTCIVPALP